MANLVPALVTLRAQVNAAYPDRSRASDGWIGDPAHAARKSDHNPDRNGWVHAVDLTHDPDDGLDIDRFTDELVAARDPRISYLIANEAIASGTAGPAAWRWRDYDGANPHTKHAHTSARAGDLAMDASPWRLPMLGDAHLAPEGKVPSNTNHEVLRPGTSDDAPRGGPRWHLQEVLAAWYPGERLVIDGKYGPHTERVVRRLQNATPGLTVDGIAGPQTLDALGL